MTSMGRRLKNNVFIIRGRDAALERTVLGFLREIGMTPVLLDDPAAPRSLSILERFENWASDAYAIVLLAPEDLGPAGADSRRRRMSQSQLFELGFLLGKLGRRFVTALYREELELPPELSGVLCIPLDDIGIWKFALLRDLSAAGFTVRSNLAVYGPRDSNPRFPEPGPALPRLNQQ